MFYCEIGHHTSKPREPRRTIVTQTRPRVYEHDGVTQKSGFTTFGEEIVREVDACVSCATAVENKLLDIPAFLR